MPNEINNILSSTFRPYSWFADILMTGWVYHRKQPLKIYGPVGTKNFVNSTLKAYEEDIKVRSMAPENLDVNVIKSDIKIIDDGLSMRKMILQ